LRSGARRREQRDNAREKSRHYGSTTITSFEGALAPHALRLLIRT
jgi:hypothetical protein